MIAPRHAPDASSALPLSLLATIAVLLSLLPIQLYSVALPHLTSDLRIGSVAAGLIPSTAFVTAACTSVPLGRYVDRVGYSKPLLLHGVASVLALGLLSVALGTVMLVAYGLLGGLVLAAANPATNHLVAERVAPSSRGRVVGWKQSGVPAAWIFTGLAVPPLVGVLGWRPAVLVAGLAPIVLFFVLLLREGRPSRRRSQPTPGPSAETSPSSPSLAVGSVGTADDRIGGMSQKISFWYALLMGCATAVVNVYLYTFAVSRLQLSTAASGMVLVVMGAAGVAGKVIWGIRSGRSRRPAVILQQLALIGLFAMGGLAVSEFVPQPMLSLTLAAVAAGFSLFAWTSPLMVLAIADSRAASGIGVRTARAMRPFFLGMFVGPPFFGLLLDLGGGFTAGWLVFGGCSAASAALVTPSAIRERGGA